MCGTNKTHGGTKCKVPLPGQKVKLQGHPGHSYIRCWPLADWGHHNYQIHRSNWFYTEAAIFCSNIHSCIIFWIAVYTTDICHVTPECSIIKWTAEAGQYSDPVSRKVWIMHEMDCLVQVLFPWRLLTILEMIPFTMNNESLVGLYWKCDYYEQFCSYCLHFN